MGREHLQNSDVNRSHEPAPNPSGGGELMSGTLAEFPSWEGPGVGRFMESPLSFFRMHWDHEPPLTRPPATLSPSEGEREGVRGRFMEREHLQNPDVNRSHEPVGIPLNRPPGTFSPTGAEGRDEGVRFMESSHDLHNP